MFVRPTQAIEIFGNLSTPFGTLAMCDLCVNFYGDRTQVNPTVREDFREGHSDSWEIMVEKSTTASYKALQWRRRRN